MRMALSSPLFHGLMVTAQQRDVSKYRFRTERHGRPSLAIRFVSRTVAHRMASALDCVMMSHVEVSSGDASYDHHSWKMARLSEG